MTKRQLALIAASFVALFYAANFSIAKEVMPHYIKPFGFILLRVIGACVLFWLVGFFGLLFLEWQLICLLFFMG